MTKFVTRLSMFILIIGIATSAAFAKTIKKEVTFANAVDVNGTVVKAGTYDVVFDDQTNELTIVKGRKVIARAPAQLEEGDRDHSGYTTRDAEGDSGRPTLLSVTLKGGKQATLANNTNGNSAQ